MANGDYTARHLMRYAVKFVVDSNGEEPTDANLEARLSGCALPVKPAWFPIIRAHVEEYRAKKEDVRGRVLHLAGDLADFRQYPPERNDLEGNCYVCKHVVPAYAGMFAMGGSDGAVWGVTLHRGCLADVKQARAGLPSAE